jgi:hypothetical protein
MDGMDCGVNTSTRPLFTRNKGGEKLNDDKELKELTAPLWIDPRDMEFFAKLQEIILSRKGQNTHLVSGDTNNVDIS